ncbi:MAG: diaminopimelate decarboxylase [Alistipes sp.]|jgi:diaminopimelate decarboxylase|nr:diaminopimelate decarboxylase [Alistipes sp.]
MLSKAIKESLRGIETPFYLYDMGLLGRTLDTIRAEAERGDANGKSYKIHYAIKANNDERILKAVLERGFGIDCVSGNELRLIRRLGFPADGIVYAGVGKSDGEIELGVREGIRAFNCESRQELQVIDEIAGRLGMRARVALRINPDVDPQTHRHISTGQADSKFGISYREIEQVATELPTYKNLDFQGLHFHIGSQITDMRVFEFFCRRVNSLVGWFAERGFPVGYINMGGGLGVNYDAPDAEPMPDFGAYFDAFRRNLEVGDAEVHFELGRAMVAQCGELITRVLFNKINSAGNEVAIIDGSMSELIRPALYEAYHEIENLDTRAGDQRRPYIVAGTVCESSDVFASDRVLPELRRGDLVTLKSAGAYGQSMSSQYNMHSLPRIVYSDQIES